MSCDTDKIDAEVTGSWHSYHA